MKFAIVGAGATGAYLGAKLAQHGEDVVLMARGIQLEAMCARGVTIREADSAEEFSVCPRVTGDLAEAVRSAEIVFLTVKGHSVASLASELGAVLRPETTVVTAQNGIPWWYFERFGGPLANTRLRTVDPDGAIARHIPAEQVVGCVVWPATRMLEPGVVEHVEGTRFTIGELDGAESQRCAEIGAALERSGLKCRISTDIRADIWLKLLGNVAFNPLSALTRATLGQITGHEDARVIAREIMVEVDSVARALGVEVPLGIDRRLAGVAKVGDHKTSMLQDLECGRPMELEPMVGAVVELGDLLGLPMPYLRSIYACAKLLQQTQQTAQTPHMPQLVPTPPDRLVVLPELHGISAAPQP